MRFQLLIYFNYRGDLIICTSFLWEFSRKFKTYDFAGDKLERFAHYIILEGTLTEVSRNTIVDSDQYEK